MMREAWLDDVATLGNSVAHLLTFLANPHISFIGCTAMTLPKGRDTSLAAVQPREEPSLLPQPKANSADGRF